ncbi:SEC-C domain-containing protein [Sporocytophaga myxococcoides]|uniref:SEC-C domain-containing protein n=1 Tax=Sporocytophaga myxococcoides TaxID=153721 RepID=UPI0006856270|nr:SEC-C domain-containing protein [Sporocytophaga myxococcoides]
MEKIDKDSPCPCGSGKKYKHCHSDKEDVHINHLEMVKGSTIDFTDLLKNHRSVQILGLLAALQLHPENHGRNVRFERLCRETLLNFSSNDIKPLASWELMKEAIESYSSGSYEEDPLANAFTETAIFEGGNYVVYSGIYVGFTDILNQLTECIFQVKNDLNKEFVKKVGDAIGLLLFMSNAVAHYSGHVAYIHRKSGTRNIEFPDYNKTVQYTEAVYFTREFLNEACEIQGYDIAILDDFILQPGGDELQNDAPEENVVNFKPIIELQDAILLYMPTGILNSLITYVNQKAKEYNCYDELLELFYARQFHLSCAALGSSGWWAADIELPPLKGSLFVREKVFQFDNQKLGYVCFVQPIKSVPTEFAGNSGKEATDPYKERTSEVVDFLRNLHGQQPFDVFSLYIIGEAWQDFFFVWSKPSAGNQSLALTYRELWTITHSSTINSLTLWKFAKCYSRTNERTRVMSTGGTLDTYAVYRNNYGSLMDSDEANPLDGLLIIENGSSDDFKREIQKQQNEHAAPIFYKGQLAYTKVTRYKNYAPIYVERELSESFRIVIESYKMPIWVTNPQTKGRRESWGTYVCEAIAFWLNKMSYLLSPYLNEQDFIQFEIEVIVADEMLNLQQFQVRQVALTEIHIKSEVIPPTIRITIPFNYIYVVSLPDNTADKMMMRTVMQGMVNYIKAAGNNTKLNGQIIEEIINSTLRPANAKMLLFNDASLNIKIDDRDLPPLYYINDTDVSYVLDNLVSYLPEEYEISIDILEKKNKIKLCDDIVTALINQISDRIALFDGAGLLKWLIKLNEKCIQVREFREILIPAKIACFSDFNSEVRLLMDDEKNLVITAHAIRTLIEFIATQIPSGHKWPNYDDIGELLALTNQLTEWGALSEAMRLGLDDPKMGLLPSGRIGTDKTLEREAFKPYAVAKTESTLFKNVEDFESNYVQSKKSKDVSETDESKALDTAFRAEFGITLTNLSKIIGALVNEAFTKGKSCMDIEESAIIKILSSIQGVSTDDLNCALKLLTLLERTGIGIPPVGYTPIDIFPWRYNRSISYIRRPLIKLQNEGSYYYYYGHRHLIQFIDNLFYLLYSGKLPNVKSELMTSWLAGVSGDKGKPFRKAVKTWIEQNSDFQVIPHEVKMENLVPHGYKESDKPEGDIDLLVIDHIKYIIYPIECKNIQGGRNVHEMKVEIDDYIGRNGNDKKAKIKKHLIRHQWLNTNKNSLASLVPNAEEYEIKSFILTADEIPLGYLKKDTLPLPLKSFAFLRKLGVSYLSDLK